MSKPWEQRHVNLGTTIVACAITLAIGLALGLFWPKLQNFLPYLGISNNSTNSTLDYSSLDEVYQRLALSYDGDLDKDALIEGAKKGLVAAVGDDYTVYMDSKTATAYQGLLRGEAGSGIGVEIGLRNGHVRILRLLDDNPAKKAGLQVGDIFYKIDGEDVYNSSTEAVTTKLHGDIGTPVEVSVLRGNKELSFTLTREHINNVSYYVTYDGSTAIITVTRFDSDTGTLVRQLVNSEDYKKHNVKKIILDLRGNTGGYTNAAKDLLSLWFDGDLILTEKRKTGVDNNTFANRGQAVLKDIPTVVLVNSSTASASEIVAGALKDYGKATLIGETTFGKGVVQTLYPLSNGTMVKVTTSRWYTPKGNSIQGDGITPDQEVTRTIDDLNNNRDPQLDAAKKI